MLNFLLCPGCDESLEIPLSLVSHLAALLGERPFSFNIRNATHNRISLVVVAEDC
jgi:hypothetical protein